MQPEYLTDPTYVRAWAVELMVPYQLRAHDPISAGDAINAIDDVVQYVLSGMKPSSAAQ